MGKSLEKTLSQVLSILVLLVFVISLVSAKLNIWIVSYIWAGAFILAWLLMLIFGLHVLFQKNSYGTSIFIAILTAVSFAILSVPAILILARFLPGLPVGLNFNNDFLNQNSGLVLYTVLILIYFAHVINSIKLRGNIENDQAFSKDYEEDSGKNLQINKNLHNDNEIEYNITKDADDKLVFESNDYEESTYDTEEVVLVEDLTNEDLEFMKDEESNG